MDIVIVFSKEDLMISMARAMASVFAVFAVLLFSPIVRAEGGDVPVIRFHDGAVEPGELVVRAQTPLRLRVVNETRDAIEFESFELNRERVVQPGAEIMVYLPALDPGSYKFFDDLHHGAAEGTITAK